MEVFCEWKLAHENWYIPIQQKVCHMNKLLDLKKKIRSWLVKSFEKTPSFYKWALHLEWYILFVRSNLVFVSSGISNVEILNGRTCIAILVSTVRSISLLSRSLWAERDKRLTRKRDCQEVGANMNEIKKVPWN